MKDFRSNLGLSKTCFAPSLSAGSCGALWIALSQGDHTAHCQGPSVTLSLILDVFIQHTQSCQFILFCWSFVQVMYVWFLSVFLVNSVGVVIRVFDQLKNIKIWQVLFLASCYLFIFGYWLCALLLLISRITISPLLHVIKQTSIKEKGLNTQKRYGSVRDILSKGHLLTMSRAWFCSLF